MRQADLIEREQGTEPVELFALETESTGTEISGGGERSALVVGEVEVRPGREGGEVVVEVIKVGQHAVDHSGAEMHPRSSSMAKLVSIISLTGVSSGMVTSITVQRAGSPIISRTSTAWRCSTPSSRVPDAGGGAKEADGVPGGGSIDDDEVVRARFFEGLDAAKDEEILDARCGRGHHLE